MNNMGMAIFGMANLIIVLLIIGGFILGIIALWKMMKAQEAMAASMKEIILLLQEGTKKREG